MAASSTAKSSLIALHEVLLPSAQSSPAYMIQGGRMCPPPPPIFRPSDSPGIQMPRKTLDSVLTLFCNKIYIFSGFRLMIEGSETLFT